MPDLIDPIAEGQVLAIALRSEQPPAEFLALPVTAFSNWQHQIIAAAIHELHAKGTPTDPEIVIRAITDRGGTDERARQLGNLAARLVTHEVPYASIGYYAERLAALSAARTATAAAAHFTQAVEFAAENDDDTAMSHALTTMRQSVDAAELAFRPAAPQPPMSLAELLEADEDPYDWLVPDLLERSDRLIVTGFEGTGKSYILAQFALCIAAGLHPLTTEPLPREHRVLIFDVENSRRQLQRRYRRIRAQVEQLRRSYGRPPVDWRHAVRIVSRPEGVALTEPRELARIEQNIALTAPDLVVAGPLYKMSSLDIRDEQAALELCATLDGLRVRHGFTLICEAHAGHANDGSGNRRVRPIGSSVFLRWPEFGFGIAPFGDSQHEEHPTVVEVKHWRGSRDERNWPRLLKHGQHLPWQPANDDYWQLRGVSA
jgi:replicative DNA helicase